MGDNFNTKNNTSKTIKDFVSFVERFNGKEVFILAGNHEKFGDGKSAIDFMKELKSKADWHIITTEPLTVSLHEKQLLFVPYYSKNELGVGTNEEAANVMMDIIKSQVAPQKTSNMLFLHQTISGFDAGGTLTDMFNEIVLPQKKLEKIFEIIVCGHIHNPSVSGKTLMTGSVFTNEVGEHEKFIYIIDEKTYKTTHIKLPCRPIIKIENPSINDLNGIDPQSIVKVVLTKKTKDIEIIRSKLDSFAAHLLVEQYPNKRKKIDFGNNLLDFNIVDLLKTYAKERTVDEKKLLLAWDMIKD